LNGRTHFPSLVFLSLSLAPAVFPQAAVPDQHSQGVFSMEKDREQLVSLDGQWRFHPGDDPHWSDPNFDDSKWPLISSTQGWSDQGYKNMSGLAWYRAKVVIPQNGPPLELYVPMAVTSYQVFVEGQMIGQFGGMPPRPSAYQAIPQTFPLPVNIWDHPHTAVIAIRLWHWPVWAIYNSGGLYSGMVIGRSNLVNDFSKLHSEETERNSISDILFAVLDALAGLTALALFTFRRREKEYLWFAAALLTGAIDGSFHIATQLIPVSITVRDQFHSWANAAETLFFLAFYCRLLRARQDWFFRLALGSIAAFQLLEVLVYMTWPISVATLIALNRLLFLPATIWIDVLVIRRATRGFPDARLVIFPQLLFDLWRYFLGAAVVASRLGWIVKDENDIDIAWQRPFPMAISDVISLIFLLAMLAILVRRFTRTARDEERLVGEVEAARTVQQVLIPDEIPEIPGFVVHAVYRPAGEVGGDFFQIIPSPHGGALVVIGDVSGKGMPAAMTVSLLVGTVRTLAHYTEHPGEMLHAMNQRMLLRSKDGFTTCLILHIDGDGAGTIANAGHLLPYVDSVELEVENGLPLGLDATASYPEFAFRLAPGSCLTMMTDGVVEARNRKGELFGFERTRIIAAQIPESIAREAQAFGQQDDITVVSIQRTRLTEKPAAISVNNVSV
jgi:stage II sporulation SpoE-like protein/beta-galactosidase-like protein